MEILVIINSKRFIMKVKYGFAMLTLIGLCIFGYFTEVNAQTPDTLVVEWSQDGINTWVNHLRDVILTDTIAGGAHVQNRVYKLQRGGYYWNSDRIDNTGYSLAIVGVPGDPSDPIYGNPPVIQLVHNNEGVISDKIIVGNGDLTLKNLYIIGADDEGVQTSYQPIELAGTGKRFIFDNIIFERSNFAIPAFTNPDNDIYFTNCVFRNLIGYPSDQQWQGRGVSIWTDQDTIVVENCTFFNIQFTPFQLEGGAANYLRFNHNTEINVGRNMAISGNSWREAYFANNLLVNVFWHGEGHADLTDPNREPRATSSGMFSIGDLASKYGPEEGRRILLANTAAWRDPAFAAYYADTIQAQPFANPITREDYFDVYDQMVATDTTWLTARPSLGTYFTSTFLDSMIQNIKDLRNGSGDALVYVWKPVLNPDGSVCHLCPSWPLPEDFSYTDAQLKTAGTDGLPLGDLNWFPSEKAIFEANKAQYIAQIQSKAGTITKLEPVMEVEAEDGTLSGTAVVENFTDIPYFDMDGAGYMEWEFEMPSAAVIELGVLTRSQDAVRGEFIRINGINIRNDAGYGEYYFTGLTNEWQEYVINQDGLIEGAEALNLTAGINTLKIEKSWGWQEFSIVYIKVGGETIITLDASNVTTYDQVVLVSKDAPYVPSKFKSVNMGTSGTIVWQVNITDPGTYKVLINYTNTGTEETGQIEVSSTNYPVTFAADPEGGGLSVLSDGFELVSGDNTITLTASNIIVDYIQLNKESVITAIAEHNLPLEYELAQNYPNPFNPTTNISFSLAQPQHVKLVVYNLLGQEVTTLINSPLTAGYHIIQFNAGNLASGIYFYRLEAGNFKTQKQMLLLK
jgi:predicted secreted protein